MTVDHGHRTGTRVVLRALRFYREAYSPLRPPRCRYVPSCSAYAEQAVRLHGMRHGTVLAAWRLLRCNPFTRGGVDPVPPARPASEGARPCPS